MTREARAEAFDRYVAPEIPALLRAAATLTPQAADAEDLVQDTLVRAWRALDRFDGRHPRAWLFTILRRTEMNRNRRTRPQLLIDPAADPLDAHPPFLSSAAVIPEDAVVTDRFDQVVADAFEALPDRQRRVVELVDLDGFGYAEAAQVLGVPIGTVESRLHRARARIRARLADAGVAPRHRPRAARRPA